MTRSQSNILTTGIILQKIEYRETSLICQVFSPELGRFSLMAKGVRKPSSSVYGLLQTLAELELVLHHKKDSQWYILKSASHLKDFISCDFTTTAVMQAGAEIFGQLHVAEHEAKEYFELLENFLSYTSQVNNNAIALLWRFFLRLFVLMGIELKLEECGNCQQLQRVPFAYSINRVAFICRNCWQQSHPGSCLKLSSVEKDLLKKLPCIGKELSNIEIDRRTARNITAIFIRHLNLHFNDHFHIKSLKTIF